MINIFCMKAVLERNLGFIGYPEYSVDTDGNVWALNYKCSKGKGDTKRRVNKHPPFFITSFLNMTLCHLISYTLESAYGYSYNCKIYVSNQVQSHCHTHISTDQSLGSLS